MASINRGQLSVRGGTNASVFGILNEMHEILGTTKSHFWPFFEATGSEIKGFASTVLNAQDEGGNITLQDEFAPIFALREEGLHAYYFSGDNSRHLVAADNANYSYEGASEPFSLGLWALPMEAGSALQALIAKYDEGVATEFSFHVTSGDVLQLDIYDGIDGATGDRRYTSVLGTVVLHEMHFYAMTYAGSEGNVLFYKDGVLMDTIAGVETSAFVNMDDTAAKLFVGGRDDGGVPDDLFQGWLALAYLTGKVLTAEEMLALHDRGALLVGV